MHAAVVRSFDHPPRYERTEEPAPTGPHQLVVDVLAAGLHPRVRSSADGSHYTSGRELPLVPGIDGVGRTAAGELLYFVLPDTTLGSMAERTLVDRRRAVLLPAASDVASIAAAMNPAMSSWIALRKRIVLTPGATVLVLGATGNAGRLALHVARHLGAGRIVAAGRGAERLEALLALGADVTVALDDDTLLREATADVDVVLDYLWAEPAARVMRALVTGRRERDRPLDWVQIGAVAGPDLALPSAALRAANLRVLGSGQGSVTAAAIVDELPLLAERLSAGAFSVAAAVHPLSEVEAVWRRHAPGQRIVFAP